MSPTCAPKFDHKLAFDQNIVSICKRANTKLKALARVVPYIEFAKQNLLMNFFFVAQFSYFSLI